MTLHDVLWSRAFLWCQPECEVFAWCHNAIEQLNRPVIIPPLNSPIPFTPFLSAWCTKLCYGMVYSWSGAQTQSFAHQAVQASGQVRDYRVIIAR